MSLHAIRILTAIQSSIVEGMCLYHTGLILGWFLSCISLRPGCGSFVLDCHSFPPFLSNESGLDVLHTHPRYFSYIAHYTTLFAFMPFGRGAKNPRFRHSLFERLWQVFNRLAMLFANFLFKSGLELLQCCSISRKSAVIQMSGPFVLLLVQHLHHLERLLLPLVRSLMRRRFSRGCLHPSQVA